MPHKCAKFYRKILRAWHFLGRGREFATRGRNGVPGHRLNFKLGTKMGISMPHKCAKFEVKILRAWHILGVVAIFHLGSGQKAPP